MNNYDVEYNKKYPYECQECGFRGCDDLNCCEECGSKEYIKVYEED